MPAAAGDAAGVKLVGIQPANPARGLPIIQGVYVLFDMRVGQPVALLDGAALDNSAHADDLGARHRRAGTTTTCAHSASSAPAHRPSHTFTRCASCDPTSRMWSLPAAHRTTSTASSTELVAGGESAIAGSYADAAACDVVCAATRSDSALFGLADVRPGTHSTWSVRTGSISARSPQTSSQRSTVAVDDLAAAKAEAGDLHLAVQEGVWSWDKVAGDLTDLASGRSATHIGQPRSPCSRALGWRCRIWRSPSERPPRLESWRHREQVRRHRRRRAGRLVVGVVPHRGRRRGHDHRQRRARQRCGARQRRVHVHRDRRAAAGARGDRQRAEDRCATRRRALRVLPKAIPSMTPWLLAFARNCTASRYESGSCRARAVQPQQRGRSSNVSSHQGVAVTLSRELLVPYHDVAKAEHHFKALQPMVEFGARIPDRVVDGDEIRRIAPAITDHVRAGLVMPGDRSIDPRRYVDSVIDILKSRNVAVHGEHRGHRRRVVGRSGAVARRRRTARSTATSSCSPPVPDRGCSPSTSTCGCR